MFAAALPLACAGDPGTDDSASDDEAEGTSTSAGDGDGDSTDGSDTGEALRPNWHQDIAPLVTANCVGCHAQDGIAPFAMTTYEESFPWSTLMADDAEAGLMPPWHAIETEICQPPLAFKHDARLADDEIAMLREWADIGAPEGDPALAAPLPDPQDLDLANPTTTVTMGTSLAVDVEGTTRDFFHCISLDPGNLEDVYVDGLQVIPGNRAIVHHVLVYVDEAAQSASWPGGVKQDCGGGSGVANAQLVAGWVPGGLPMEPPPGVAVELPVGARLVLNVHYHATGGGPETDEATGMALRWTTDKPEYVSLFELVGAPGVGDSLTGPLMIPAGESDHVEEFEWVVSAAGQPFPDSIDARLWAVANHMHKVGVDMRVWVEDRDTGDETCLLQTPNWDFNWQRVYEYDADIGQDIRLKAGDIVHVSCTYDNTLQNTALVEALAEVGEDAPIDVSVGEGTLDEMCLAGIGVGVKGI
ncbi:hypothetical protein ACNOYE_29145 [Nannocystaceae bacterium ST9]